MGRGGAYRLNIDSQQLITAFLFLPETGQLELVEKHQLLPSHWRFLYQLPQAGVVLPGASVDDAGEAWQEAGKTVLHLLCWSRRRVSKGDIERSEDATCQFLERMLQVLAGHQVGGPGHFAHHDLLRFHQIERTFLDDGRLLAQSYGDLERVGHVALSHHGGPGAGGQVGGPAGVGGPGGVGGTLGGETFHVRREGISCISLAHCICLNHTVMYQTVKKR